MTDAHTHASIGTGTVLPVVESFYTVQGEGVNTGKAAWFIRLGGCDVRCPWCDSRNSWDAASFPLTDIEDIVSPITGSPAVNVVITGGEPLMHDLGPLCGRLKEKGYNIFLETSGTHPLSGVFDWICVSPKKHRPPLQEVLEKADELKAVAGCPGDIAWAEDIRKHVRRQCVLLLQSEWGQRQSATPIIIEYVKEHPEWRISLQTHKYLGIP